MLEEIHNTSVELTLAQKPAQNTNQSLLQIPGVSFPGDILELMLKRQSSSHLLCLEGQLLHTYIGNHTGIRSQGIWQCALQHHSSSSLLVYDPTEQVILAINIKITFDPSSRSWSLVEACLGCAGLMEKLAVGGYNGNLEMGWLMSVYSSLCKPDQREAVRKV